jgi:hypothetical protein
MRLQQQGTGAYGDREEEEEDDKEEEVDLIKEDMSITNNGGEFKAAALGQESGALSQAMVLAETISR